MGAVVVADDDSGCVSMRTATARIASAPMAPMFGIVQAKFSITMTKSGRLGSWLGSRREFSAKCFCASFLVDILDW